MNTLGRNNKANVFEHFDRVGNFFLEETLLRKNNSRLNPQTGGHFHAVGVIKSLKRDFFHFSEQRVACFVSNVGGMLSVLLKLSHSVFEVLPVLNIAVDERREGLKHLSKGLAKSAVEQVLLRICFLHDIARDAGFKQLAIWLV